MTTNLNPEFKHIVEAYEDALYMPKEDGNDLIKTIEKDIAKLGDKAVIAGKDTLQDFYQDRLNKLILNAKAYGNRQNEWISEIQDLRRKIEALGFEIDYMSGKIINPDIDHPAMQKLQAITNGVTGLDSARLLLSRKVVFHGIDVKKTEEYAIEFTGVSRDSVILRRDDLISMLQLLDENTID